MNRSVFVTVSGRWERGIDIRDVIAENEIIYKGVKTYGTLSYTMRLFL